LVFFAVFRNQQKTFSSSYRMNKLSSSATVE
jgi:hypothetical protein